MSTRERSKFLVIGGAGFIGSNFAEKLTREGFSVVILDDLSRKGAASNLLELLRRFPEVRFVRADISKDRAILRREVAASQVVFHLAAQVGVTTSVADPRRDFEINALGTLNVLEAARLAPEPPVVIYASTNKVYGGLENVEVVETQSSYRFKTQVGINEKQELDFHSPYGCSKGMGDQYVHDYARIYGLKTVVFRQSCVYGPGQFGTEDQGWVAWFCIAALLGLPVVFYGNGKQTRDVLSVDDLFEAWISAVQRIDSVAGGIFNVGGGQQQVTSLQQFVVRLHREFNLPLQVRYHRWRPGDQRIYVSDTSLAQVQLNWRARTGISEGVAQLINWVRKREGFFREMFHAQLAEHSVRRCA